MRRPCVWSSALLAGLIVVALHQSSSAQDWNQWRGPNRDGVVSAFTAPKVWPDTLKPLWKVTVGAGHSSPVVVAGKHQLVAHDHGTDRDLAYLARLLRLVKRYPHVISI